jgi:rod shape-determining protein MreD
MPNTGTLETEGHHVRKSVVALTLVVLLLLSVVVQVTVVNRLPFPGLVEHSGATPDIVLLLCAAMAVWTTPAKAALIGFVGGLALDVAPPADHTAGESALVFCVVCYFAARAYRLLTGAHGQRERFTAFTIVVVAVVVGEAGKAALGRLLRDPDVTTRAVAHILPNAILYDLLLSPIAFWVVMRIMAFREPAGEPKLHADYGFNSVFRQASVGATPRLRLVGTGMGFVTAPARVKPPRLRLAGTSNYTAPPVASRTPKLKFSGSGTNYQSQPVAGRVPKLHLSDARSPSLKITASAYSGTQPAALPAGRKKKLNFSGDLPVNVGGRAKASPSRGWLRAAESSALAAGLASRQRKGRRPVRLRFGRQTGGAINFGPQAGSVINGRARAPRLRFNRQAGGSINFARQTGGVSAGRTRTARLRFGHQIGGVINGRPGAAGIPSGLTSGSGSGLRSAFASRHRRGRGLTRGLAGGRGSVLRSGSASSLSSGRRNRHAINFTSARPSRRSPFARISFNWSPARPSVIPFIPQPSRTAAEVLAARSAPSGLSALAGRGTPMARMKRNGRAPHAGWLGGSRRAATPAVRLNPRSGWLGRRRSRTVIGSSAGARPRTYVSTPTRAWAHRSRSPWRRRGRRLLRMMGVGE